MTVEAEEKTTRVYTLAEKAAEMEGWSLVMVTHTLSKAAANEWVQAASDDAGMPIDWGYMGGRVCVRCDGDPQRAMDSLRKFRKIHDVSFIEEYTKCLPGASQQADIHLSYLWV